MYPKEEDLRVQLNQERAARVQAEMEYGKSKIEVESLQMELAKLKKELSSIAPTVLVGGNGFLSAETSKDIVLPVPMSKARAGGWISGERGAVVATFIDALKKYKLVSLHPDFPNRSRVPSGGVGHDLPIRDIALQQTSSVCYGGTVATASLDGTIKLISVSNLNEVCDFRLEEPVWSVCFARDDLLVAGTVRGKIMSFDPRMPKSPVSVLSIGNEPVHSIVPLQTPGVCCAAAFTRVSIVTPETGSSDLEGLSARAAGDQYSSLALGEDGTIAVSVRSQSKSFVEVGLLGRSENQDTQFRLCERYEGHHGRPSGRIALFNRQTLLVPDELSKSCVRYPSGTLFAASDNVYAGAWFCGSPDLTMLLSADTVRFVPLA